jgi:hypothetical protein
MVTGVTDSGEPHTITCETGGSLQARHVVLATHLPIMDRSGHFMLLPPSKSLVRRRTQISHARVMLRLV